MARQSIVCLPIAPVDRPGEPPPVCPCGRVGASFYTPSAKDWLCQHCYHTARKQASPTEFAVMDKDPLP